jgi:hypothetical protein
VQVVAHHPLERPAFARAIRPDEVVEVAEQHLRKRAAVGGGWRHQCVAAGESGGLWAARREHGPQGGSMGAACGRGTSRTCSTRGPYSPSSLASSMRSLLCEARDAAMVLASRAASMQRARGGGGSRRLACAAHALAALHCDEPRAGQRGTHSRISEQMVPLKVDLSITCGARKAVSEQGHGGGGGRGAAPP